MKTKIITLILLAFIGLSHLHAQVGIGTTTPDASSTLDITATDKGFLPPRMTTTQRDAIKSPVAGLVIYNSTTNSIEFSNGTDWVKLDDNTTTAIVDNTTAPTGTGGAGIGTTTPDKKRPTRPYCHRQRLFATADDDHRA